MKRTKLLIVEGAESGPIAFNIFGDRESLEEIRDALSELLSSPRPRATDMPARQVHTQDLECGRECIWNLALLSEDLFTGWPNTN